MLTLICYFWKDIQTAKEDFLERQALKQNAIEVKPSEMLTGDKGKLVKCKVRLISPIAFFTITLPEIF